MTALDRLREKHKESLRLHREAEVAAQERNRAVAEVLTSGEAQVREVSEALGLSTQRVYDMASKARRAGSQ